MPERPAAAHLLAAGLLVYLYHIFASLNHMKKSTGTLVVWKDGTRIDVISHYAEFPHPGGGGPRGKIAGYSKASRLRLVKRLTTITEKALKNSLFITLTYHKTQVPHEKLKRDLKHFVQLLRRNHPNDSGVWRIEAQKRGSPHYHILHFGERGGKRFLPHAWISERWNRIAEPGNLLHLESGTSVERCSGARAIGGYIAKYVGKPEEPGRTLEGIGRHWGVYGRSKIPVSETELIPLDAGVDREIIGDWLSDQPGSGAHCRRASRFTPRNADVRRSARQYLTFDDAGHL